MFMAIQNGWIKVHRKILDWEWYCDDNAFRLFMHLLIKANHDEGRWQGVTIKPGQLVTGRIRLASELKLGEQQIRTALDKLKATSEITIKTTNKYSIITILNWEKYQYDLTNKLTNGQPTSNQQVTTNKKNKEVKNDKKKRIYGEFENVHLTEGEYTKLCEAIGQSGTDNLIAEMSSYLESTPKRYKSHYAALQNWARRRVKEYADKRQSKGKGLIKTT